MSAHVDLYSVDAVRPSYEFLRRIDPANVARASIDGALPYWNGYVLYTAVHDDDACEEHRPADTGWPS